MHLLVEIRMISPQGLGIDTNEVAVPTLRRFVVPHGLGRRFPLSLAVGQRFPGRSLSTTSSIVSETSRLSLALSSAR